MESATDDVNGRDWLIPVSDYILAVLRQHLGATHELYVKWNLIRAYNGAVLDSPSGSVQILFHMYERAPAAWTKAEDIPPSMRVCRLDDTIVSFTQFPNAPDTAACEIAAAAERKAKRLAAQALEWMRLLRLIQVSCLLVASAETAGMVVEEIASRISKDVGSGRPIISSPQPGLEEPNYEVDLGFPLTDALSEVEVAARLKAIFPGIIAAIDGWGQVLINHDGGACADDRLVWAHIYGRHFFEPCELS